MRISIIAALASFCLLSATSGQAQSSGTFTTFLSGQPVVTENYVMSSGTEGLRIDADISAKGTASSQKITTQVSRDGSSRFTIEAGGATQFSAEFRDSTVKLQIAGQPERSLPSKANLVAEPGLAPVYSIAETVRCFEGRAAGLKRILARRVQGRDRRH
jgi:hypothetical protein